MIKHLSCSSRYTYVFLTADLRNDVIPVVNNMFGSGVGPIFLNQLNCEGGESSILTCESPVVVHFCTHKEDVGVSCPG